MVCYCANFYGHVKCSNKVSHFGDRCKLCKLMNEGHSATYEFVDVLAQAPEYDSEAVADDSGREEYRHRRIQRRRTGGRREMS
jgi:hypothetical protein